MRPLLLFLLLPPLFLQGACQAQTGHRVIAAAVRTLLDKAYAGIDYPSYHDSLKELEAVVAEQIATTPTPLQPQAEQMLAYLRTAEEVLRWQSEQGNGGKQTANDQTVAAWLERYPFLRAAMGAHTANVFDVPTALMLLWDKTDEVLRGFQVKSKPL